MKKMLLYCLFISCSALPSEHINTVHADLRAETALKLEVLWNKGFDKGDQVAAQAYELFYDAVHDRVSSVQCSKEVIEQLKSVQLADCHGCLRRDKLEVIRPSQVHYTHAHDECRT